MYKVGDWVQYKKDHNMNVYIPEWQEYVKKHKKFKIINIDGPYVAVETYTDNGYVLVDRKAIKLFTFKYKENKKVKILNETGKIKNLKNDTFDFYCENGEILRIKDGLLNGLFNVDIEAICKTSKKQKSL